MDWGNDASEKDAELLEAALERDDLSPSARAAFDDMLAKLTPRGLSPDQREWALAASRGERYAPKEKYLNLYSSGQVPRGREVPTPEVLKRLPLKPPGRTG
jgi:hypothetical protein